MASESTMSIGEVARRAGVSAAAVRWYERLGLVHAQRTTGNQRVFHRSVLRRLAVIAAGQRVGLSLAEIGAAFADLPTAATPTREDWTRFSAGWRDRIDHRIGELQALRDDLDGCIGCGCLSLDRCSLFNPSDQAADEGAGSRWLRQTLGSEHPA